MCANEDRGRKIDVERRAASSAAFKDRVLNEVAVTMEKSLMTWHLDCNLMQQQNGIKKNKLDGYIRSIGFGCEFCMRKTTFYSLRGNW